MRINWFGYYDDNDGYGRFNTRTIQALRRAGVEVNYMTKWHNNAPSWMKSELGIDFNNLTISCVPPIESIPIRGRHWLITMLESNQIDHESLMSLDRLNPEQILVPCNENKITFERAGITTPITVWRGGTDPEEFPEILFYERGDRPYTFLCLTDRGLRKGWSETWDAFYKAFGGKTTGEQDVRLIMKYLPHSALVDTMTAMAGAQGADPRIIYQNEKAPSMYEVFKQADCVVLPSYFEGWGMPHREAAMMGLPVITTQYSGMNDGFTDEWAIIVGHKEDELGWWVQPDVESIALKMRWAYDNRERAAGFGSRAARWLRENQTWDHAAETLIRLIGGDHVNEMGNSTWSVDSYQFA